jgi:hypothetical protein
MVDLCIIINHLNNQIMKANSFSFVSKIFKVVLFGVLFILVSCTKKEESKQGSSQNEVQAPDIDIHSAVISGNLEAVKQHILAGSDLNEKDPFGGSSPLISACVFGQPEIAQALIDAGVDINFQNNDGSTALISAAFFGRPEIVKMLLDKGADKSIQSNFGSTAYQSVSGPYSDVKPVYEMMDKQLGPLGLKLDFEYLEKIRPVIAEQLK